jgi:hypothetical protein
MPNIRTKGQGGEREECKTLVEYGLVNEASRNLDQVREGGGDVEVLSHFSIEVKRHENLAIKSWWSQASASAARVGKIPAVWWRPNKKAWVVMLPKGTVPDVYKLNPIHMAEKTAKCGRVIEQNYPHLEFIHYEYFLAWYKSEYVREVK